MPRVAGEADVELNFHDEWKEKKGLEYLEICRKKNIGGGMREEFFQHYFPLFEGAAR